MNTKKWFNSIWFYCGLLILGGIFLLLYIQKAGANVVYTDYIRVINQYIGEKDWLNKYILDWSFFDRPPLALLGIYINVNLFHLNTIFDMALGCIGLLATISIILKKCYDEDKWFIACIVCIIGFSLTKWEMLLNGTGWVHFWAFALFYLHFYLLDRWFLCNKKKISVKVGLITIPIVAILFVATFYCAIYSIVIIVFYLIKIRKNIKEKCFKEIKCNCIFLGATAVPFLLYCFCLLMGVETKVRGEGSIIAAFFNDPIYFIKFTLFSFASDCIGAETAERIGLAENVLLTLGILVIIGYLIAIWVNIKEKIYLQSYLPIILLGSGVLNHLIIVYSRWGLHNVAYGMSSRYSLQYLSAIIGVVLTWGYVISKIHFRKNMKLWLISLAVLTVISGNLITNGSEWMQAKYRKEYLNETKSIGLNYKNETDEQLKVFQTKVEKIKAALKIIEEEQLNIFYDVPSAVDVHN